MSRFKLKVKFALFKLHCDPAFMNLVFRKMVVNDFDKKLDSAALMLSKKKGISS